MRDRREASRGRRRRRRVGVRTRSYFHKTKMAMVHTSCKIIVGNLSIIIIPIIIHIIVIMKIIIIIWSQSCC